MQYLKTIENFIKYKVPVKIVGCKHLGYLIVTNCYYDSTDESFSIVAYESRPVHSPLKKYNLRISEDLVKTKHFIPWKN